MFIFWFHVPRLFPTKNHYQDSIKKKVWKIDVPIILKITINGKLYVFNKVNKVRGYWDIFLLLRLKTENKVYWNPDS